MPQSCLRAWAWVAVGLLVAGTVQGALAGVFSVTPVRIYMTPKDRAVAVTIANEGESPVVLQADLYTWTQSAEGVDELTPSEDLILAPPIVKLGPRAKQVVRLARLQPPDAARQLTYRLILREVPEAGPSRGIEVPVALALSLPVFITPPAAKPGVACTARRAAPRNIEASCANDGTAYAQVREIVLRQGTETVGRFEGGSYILPGARKLLTLDAERPVPGGALQMTVTFDDGRTQTFDVSLP